MFLVLGYNIEIMEICSQLWDGYNMEIMEIFSVLQNNMKIIEIILSCSTKYRLQKIL